jgi:formylglycine-generating enzyme required for sulfatase activity
MGRRSGTGHADERPAREVTVSRSFRVAATPVTNEQFAAVDATHAEPRGYLAATRTPDGVVHLLSSALHYRFTLEWLEAAAD